MVDFSNQTQPVVVTGAGGFIGRAVVRRLVADGATVIGVDTNPAGVPEVATAVRGDVRTPQSWAAHLHGARAVIHAAALVSNVAPLQAAWEMNVAGSAAVAQAAAAAGVPRMVHISSIAVYGFDFPDQVTEDYPVRLTGFSYPDTKIGAEAVLLAAHARGDIEMVIVRPGDVYGPESRPWVLEPLRIIRAHQALLPRGGRGVFSPVYIDNLVDGIIAALNEPTAGGRVYNLTDGLGVSCREYFGRLADMIGGRVRSLPAPPALVLASATGAVQRAFGGNSELCAASVHMLNRRGTYCIDRARADLGYDPAVDLDEGMARTSAWLRA